MTDIQVLTEKPHDFAPSVEVAGCYCRHGPLLLMVLRHKDKPQGLTWAIPCGKLEMNETPLHAVKREVFEEIGVQLTNPLYLGKLFIRNQESDYICHMFEEEIGQVEIDLNLAEHHHFQWATIDEAFNLPLMDGGAKNLSLYLAQAARAQSRHFKGE